MGDWQLIVPLLLSWLDRWTALLSKLPEGMALAAILLPIAIAIYSKRSIVVLGCMLLVVIAFCAFVAPSDIAMTLATGVYLGSLIIALSGIVARRTGAFRRAEFASLQKDVNRLRQDVNRLSHAEQGRLMRELKSTEEHNARSVPASGDLGAVGSGSSTDPNPPSDSTGTRRRKVARNAPRAH